MGHCVTLIAILSFLTLACFPHLSHAAVPNVPVDNLVVFGDSYSDLGNFHRWTNGPVWSENVAVAWNASLYSFAYTGSACDNELYPDVPATDRMPSIRDQIELYYNLDLGLDANKTVFAIWVGITDIQKAYQQSLGTEDTQPDFGNIAKCIGQQVRNIRKAFKADRIMVFNVPPLEYMPFFVDDDNALDRAKWGAAAEQLNRMLRKDIAILNRNHHALKLDLVDIHSLLSDIVEDPSMFSFTDASHAYLDACQNECDNKIDDYLWWDRTHMTGGAHRAIANSILLSGSYANPTSIDSWSLSQVQALIERPGSKHRSPIYVSPPNSGLIDRIVQEKTASSSSSRLIQVDEFKYYSDPYTTYTPNVPLAEYLVAVEKQRNPEFARFIADCEKHERFRRLAFRHFLLNPVTRMQRYPLLLQAIIKKTDEDHIDRRYLLNCKEMIQAIASRSDMQTAAVKQQVEILSINDVLTCKPGELHDVQLTDPQRRLYHRGDLKRRAQAIEVTEKADIHAFVFDHMLLMTKVRKGSHGDTEYRIWKRPIPMQMLFVQSLGGDYYGSTTTTTATSTSSTSATLTSASSATAAALASSSATTPTPAMVSLTLQHLGHRDGIYHFFVASHEEKQQWIRAIEEAKTALRKRQGDNDVFEVRTLDDASFRYFGSVAGQGRISCSVPFVSMTGERKIVIGTDAGVFIKTEGQSSVRPVLSCDNVTQVAVMERHHILLVLTDKVLKAYSIDALDAPKSTRNSDRAYEVAQNVNFFQVGFCNYKDLVVYKKKKSTSSVFVALEPVCNMRDAKSEKLFTQRTGLFSSRGSGPSWFKLYKEFYVGAEASNIHFLKSKVSVVVESRGFEIIDPENLVVGGRNIPDSADPQFNFIQRHAEPLKPLAMYRIQDKFLLCYNRFAFYVNNRNGSLVQRGAGKSSILCEWNGSPDHIVYQHPYILAVDQQFIEIRHVDTGELVQIIKGDNLRLTHYNGGETPIIHGCMTHSQRPDMQHLFQLCLSNQHNQRANSGRRSMR